jgi:hypothetical protein
MDASGPRTKRRARVFMCVRVRVRVNARVCDRPLASLDYLHAPPHRRNGLDPQLARHHAPEHSAQSAAHRVERFCFLLQSDL